MLPAASRDVAQPSSSPTYSYPAAHMPLVTNASAFARIRASLTFRANAFQLFQPSGGVRARPLSGNVGGFGACNGLRNSDASRMNTPFGLSLSAVQSNSRTNSLFHRARLY